MTKPKVREITNPVDDALTVIAATVEAWKAKNTPEAIERKTLELLNANSEEIVNKLLGFKKDSWDKKWELDHCNGRSGNSAAGDYLKNVQAETIRKWLSNVPLPELSQRVIKELTKEMESAYVDAYRQQLEALTVEKANEDAKAAFDKLTNKDFQNNYFKTLALIQPTNT